MRELLELSEDQANVVRAPWSRKEEVILREAAKLHLKGSVIQAVLKRETGVARSVQAIHCKMASFTG